jgi:hypothetical protein
MSFVRNLTSAAFVIGALVLPSTASAQAGATETPQPAATETAKADARSAASGPRIAPMGIRRLADVSATQRAQPQSMGKPMAMMIVGGAAVILGALIGDDVGTIFMLGGTIAFLIGLYEYIK